MEMNKVYNRKNDNNDFLDLVELLREIRKDEINLRVPPMQEAITGLIFNPLLLKYYTLKDEYFKAQKINPESFTKEQLTQMVKKLVGEQPNYQEAMDYIVWEEENQKREEEQEEER